MPTAAPKALLRRELARSVTRSAQPSNSAGWRKGKPISTRASPPHPNGTSRPATHLSRRPAAGSRTRKALRCGSARDRRASSCRNLSPGAIRRPHPAHDGHTLLRQIPLSRQVLLQRRPALLCFPHEAGGVGREGLPALLAAEQVKPAFRDHPEPRVAGDRDAARHIDRIVAAELRPVDFRMRHKCGAIALVAKTPNGASLGSLEIGLADHRTGVDEVADRVETLDCKAGVTVDHHPLCGNGLGRKSPISLAQDTCQHSEHGYCGAKYWSGPRTVSFLPLCRHTWCR